MKNLFKNTLRSLKNNKISVIGLMILIFLGLGVYCVMNNTTTNISNAYNKIATSGKLHDFVVNELYDVGNASFKTNTKLIKQEINFDNNGHVTRSYSFLPNSNESNPLPPPNILINELWSKSGQIDKNDGNELPKKIYVPIPELKTAHNDKLKQTTYTRSYDLFLDPETSDGLYQIFALSKNEYTHFKLTLSNTFYDDEIPYCFKVLNYIVHDQDEKKIEKIFSTNINETGNIETGNIFNYDVKKFSELLNNKTNDIYNEMINNNKPVTKFIDDNYQDKIDYKYFSALNVTTTNDNIYYKIIKSNPNDKIDKIVLFNDQNGHCGFNLFDVNDASVYDSKLEFVDFDNKPIPLGKKYDEFQYLTYIPKSYNDLATINICSRDECKKWTDLEKYIYSQIIQIRFKRMISGNITDNSFYDKFKEIAQINQNNKRDYFKQLFEDDNTPLANAYNNYYNEFVNSYNENINIAPNGTVVFNWNKLGLAPQTCTISNWTTNFCVVNPQFLKANDKYVLDLNYIVKFKPFQYWYNKTLQHNASLNDINENILIKWFNSLNNNEFTFWINPKNAKCDQDGNLKYYANINTNENETIVINKDDWSGVSDEYLIGCGGFNKIILGCGITPDFNYPIVDLTRPTPNTKSECLIYCNDLAYEDTKLAFANSSLEEYLVGIFNNVDKSHQQQIIKEINQWVKQEKLMLWPKEMNCAFFADDKANILTPTSFRIFYIPHLINTINIITIVLCCFIAFLSFMICMIIIKRFIEKGRINIGIMLANGIKKFTIALSLIPFVLIPSAIGGIVAYITGFFLQAQGIRLFQNYWTLETSILSFSWLAMFICIIIPFVLFIIVCFIATYWILRCKATLLMKSGSEFKSNSFSRWVKKPFKYTNVLTRFRISIAFNSLPRLLVLAIASCLTMTSLIFSFASLNKLSESHGINATQNSYNFNLELTTPTSSGSVYSVIDFSKIGNKDENGNEIGVGYSCAKDFVFNTNWNTNENINEKWYDPYSYPQLTKHYAWEEINKIENSTKSLLSDEGYKYRKILNKFGNLILPNENDAKGHTSDLFYLNDKIMSKLTMDYNMGIADALASNPWQLALSLMPASTRNISNNSYQQIIDMVGKKIYNAKNNDKFYEQYEQDDGTQTNKFKECIIREDKPDEQGNYHYHIDPNNIKWGMLNSHQAFNEYFIKLIKKIFTDINLMQTEYPISYGFVPINWSNNPNIKKDELYTYIDATFDNTKSNKKQIKINGIKNKSSFINLLDAHGTRLNDLLWNETFLSMKEVDNKTIYPIIINAYSAHKYNLKVNSTIDVTITNTVDRFERQIHPDKFIFDKSNKIKWKVIGISCGTTNDGFYCPQEIANKLIGLPDGKSWNKTHKYMMWSEDNGEKEWSKSNIPMVVDIAGIDENNINRYDHITTYKLNLDYDSNKKSIPENERWNVKKVKKSNKDVTPPIGFNGIYTQNNKGKPITSGMYTYSYTGMYPGTSVYKSNSTINKMTELLRTNNNLAIANLVTGVNEPKYYDACTTWLNKTSRKDEDEYLVQYTKICNEFIDLYLNKYFGDTTMITSISSAIDAQANNTIYKNLISTFNLAESSIMAIIIPMTFVIVSIISNLIIDDSKKLAAMLKTLGYSDGKNAAGIFALFLPTIFIGLLAAIPLTKFVILMYQNIVFNFANILVNIGYTWYHCLAAISGVSIILGTSYVMGWFSLKKDKLVERIK